MKKKKCLFQCFFYFCLITIFLFSCKKNLRTPNIVMIKKSENSLKQTENAKNKLTNKDDIEKINTLNYRDMIEIVPVEEGIVGHNSNDYFSYERDNLNQRGVFIEGRKVKLNKFKIAKYELTYEIWSIVYNWAIKNGYKFNPKSDFYVYAADYFMPDPLKPITGIYWTDAIVWTNAYTELMNGSDEECVYRISETNNNIIKDATSSEALNPYYDKSKKGYRLPTEAEWEYAARYQGDDKVNAEKYGSIYLTKLDSVSGAKLPIGYEKIDHVRLGLKKSSKARKYWEQLKDEMYKYANVMSYYINGSLKKIFSLNDDKYIRVGQKEANALGLCDMSGNVGEYCFDIFADVEKGFVEDPIGMPYSKEHQNRVIRGGDYTLVCIISVGSRFKAEDPRAGIRLVMKI